MNEQICVTFDSYEDFNRNLLSELYSTNKFADITLISDDQVPIKVHKFVLSFHSKVFKNLFENDINQTCIYLRGVSNTELRTVLQFLYLGEAVVPHERLTESISVAQDLAMPEILSKLQELKALELTIEDQMINVKEFPIDNFEEMDMNNEDPIINVNAMVKEDNIEGIPCDQCELKFKTKRTFQGHKASVHDKLRFGCQQCGKNFSRVHCLNKHVDSVHNDAAPEYSCQKCDFQASAFEQLRRHAQSDHKHNYSDVLEVKFQKKSVKKLRKQVCRKCDFTAKHEKDLRAHVLANHIEK